MRLIFAGTPGFAATSLQTLLAAGHEVSLVLTQPDRPAGRGMKQQPSPVKQCAQTAGIAVYQPEKLSSPESWEPLKTVEADLMIVVAYGLILPQKVLDIPRLGCLNVHASLLPRWRGAAPIHRAIEAGDTQTGVCIMQMDAGLDTGPVLAQRILAIAPDETTGTLETRLASLGADLLCEVLAQAALPQAHPQSTGGITYAHKINKKEAAIDWNTSAEEIHRRVRAFNPFPGARFVRDEQIYKVWQAHAECGRVVGVRPGEVVAAGADGLRVACADGILNIQRLQPPGSRQMSIADYLAGHSIPAGTVFS